MLLFLFACDDTTLIGVSRPDSMGDSVIDTAGVIVVDHGVVVLAGGGTEGDEGDAESWSARLYGELLRNGDVTGDGRVRVAVLSAEVETEWLPEYFVWLGADEAENLTVPDRTTAEATDLEGYDAVFLKGGDQGVYYDAWAGTALAQGILYGSTYAKMGVGGTSAGAMSLAAYALAGGQDLVSLDVLQDSHTAYLDDTDGGSSIHEDFLALVPATLIDTHMTERGRLGRLIGATALATEQRGAPLLGLGLAERTGVVIADGYATVIGDGAVTLVRGEATNPTRIAGEPLVWTDLQVDRLVDGWIWRTETMAFLPKDGVEVTWDGVSTAPTGPWYADGDLRAHEARFSVVADRAPLPYATHAGDDLPVLPEAIGVLDAYESDGRCAAEETVWRALADHPGATGFLVSAGTTLTLTGSEVLAEDNPASQEAAASVIVLDSSTAAWTGLSPAVSSCDTGDGSLHAAAMLGATAHVYFSAVGGLAWSPQDRAIFTVD